MLSNTELFACTDKIDNRLFSLIPSRDFERFRVRRESNRFVFLDVYIEAIWSYVCTALWPLIERRNSHFNETIGYFFGGWSLSLPKDWSLTLISTIDKALHHQKSSTAPSMASLKFHNFSHPEIDRLTIKHFQDDPFAPSRNEYHNKEAVPMTSRTRRANRNQCFLYIESCITIQQSVWAETLNAKRTLFNSTPIMVYHVEILLPERGRYATWRENLCRHAVLWAWLASHPTSGWITFSVRCMCRHFFMILCRSWTRPIHRGRLLIADFGGFFHLLNFSNVS